MSSEWESVGRIVYEEGRFSIPKIPAVPGLYRLRFDSGAVYIGEAGNIQRRLGDYLVYYPGVGIESEYRLNKRLLEERGAFVDILVEEDFSTRSARCIREHQEINLAKKQFSRVLNGGTLQERIHFHRAEIVRLEAKLRDKEPGVDLDETMHVELLRNEAANAESDNLAREQARRLGFSEDEMREHFDL